MDPMLGREVIKRQQIRPILDQAINRALVFGAVLGEDVHRNFGRGTARLGSARLGAV